MFWFNQDYVKTNYLDLAIICLTYKHTLTLLLLKLKSFSGIY